VVIGQVDRRGEGAAARSVAPVASSGGAAGGVTAIAAVVAEEAETDEFKAIIVTFRAGYIASGTVPSTARERRAPVAAALGDGGSRHEWERHSEHGDGRESR